MAETTDAKRAGVLTSEYAAARSASVWGIVATVLGLLTTVGSAIGDAVGQGSEVGIIVGALIAVAGILQNTLGRLGYIKSRTEVKKGLALAGQ